MGGLLKIWDGTQWCEIETGTADHGSLSGLADDDHTQYLLADGSRALTGNQSAGSNKITNLADGSSSGEALHYGQTIATNTGESGKIPRTGLGGELAGNFFDHGDVSGLSDDDHTHYALADGTRAAWAAQASPPGSPSDGDVWFRTTAPQKLFVRVAADSRWYAMESILLTFNRNGTMAGGEWMGHHRINALSAASRGITFPFTIQWYSMEITSTTVPDSSASVDLRIGGSDVHTINWDGSNNNEQENIDEVQSTTQSIRAQLNYSSGTAPANPHVILLGREYV